VPISIPSRAGLALIALLTVASASAQTKSFRCKNDLVNIGDSKASVLQKCGEPMMKDAFCKPIETTLPPGSTPTGPNGQILHAQSCRDVDSWTYNPGYGQFLTSLQFEAGQLARIQYGDRAK